MRVAGSAEVVAVKVPAAEIQRNHPRPSFDQTPGQQKMFEIPRGPIAEISLGSPLPYRSRTVGSSFERSRASASLTRREDVQSLLVDHIHPGHHPADVHVPAEFIQGLVESLAVIQAVFRDAVEDHVCPRRSRGAEGGVPDTKKSGQPGRSIGRVTGIWSQSHEGRHGRDSPVPAPWRQSGQLRANRRAADSAWSGRCSR